MSYILAHTVEGWKQGASHCEIFAKLVARRLCSRRAAFTLYGREDAYGEISASVSPDRDTDTADRSIAPSRRILFCDPSSRSCSDG